MSASHYRYPVKLSEQQRTFLEAMVHMSHTPARHYLVARVLLTLDQSWGEPSHSDGQIADILSISRRTVIRIKQRFVQKNLEVALIGSFPREHPERRCLDGKGEAHLISLACSQAPDGRQRWTLELLANQMVHLGYVEHISPETVRKTLKKNELKPWLKKSWCFPKKADSDFVYRMEDVLDVYCQPYDPAIPRICMDELGKNLVKDKYPPEPAKPGQVAREDYTYEKQGSANLFIAYEPLAGKRYLKVTEHRTKKDWASFMQELLEEHYPDAKKIILVMDNLNTHTSASFYEMFPPEQAHALANRLEIHYTPKHASWLNIAEIELSILVRQGLAHNIATSENLWKPSSELAGSSQPASRYRQLALSHGGCTHQAQTTLSCAATRWPVTISGSWSSHSSVMVEVTVPGSCSNSLACVILFSMKDAVCSSTSSAAIPGPTKLLFALPG